MCCDPQERASHSSLTPWMRALEWFDFAAPMSFNQGKIKKRSRLIANPLRLAAIVLLGGSFVSAALATPPGRMTGGGSIYCPVVERVTHGFQLHCDANGPDFAPPIPKPNTLEINFSGGENFHLTDLQTANCSGPTTTRPNAPFTTMDGSGVGTFNQQPATIVFQLTDTAEPGAGVDTAYFKIVQGGVVKLDCGNWLEGGNHQAHRATGSKQ